jgi:hypothetical protein
MGNEHTAKPKFLGNIQGDNPTLVAAKSAPTLPSASVVVPSASTATASPSSPSQKKLPPAPPSQLPLAKPQTSAIPMLPAPTTPPPVPPAIPKPLPPGNLQQTPAVKPLPPQPVATPPSLQSENTQVRSSPPPLTVQPTQPKIDKPLPPKPVVTPVQQSSLETGKYRVLITDASPDLKKLKQFVKNPFHREYEGRTVLQVGVFSSESSAQQIIKQLNSQGFKAIVTGA